ncbi:hypothetical protein ACFVS9_28000 [Streptomyces sp. NPDC058008]|uniref:ParB/RepB/Spo0J family partition protein n=1 Tax=Streptomyces sp. NPDC058008 TaxID=3346303 RepID=UPI0036E47500
MARDEFDDFFGEEEPNDVIDTKAAGRLLRVPLNRIAPNLVNPRTEFGTKEELEDFGRSLKRRQLHAVPVVSRKAYLDLWPEHREVIGNVDVVIVSGERRFRGATAVDLPALECVINDEVAASRKTFLDAVVSENIDRQNFDAIEEATAVEALVQAFGTAGAVAKHYERGDGWVSQRRILLRLAPEAQALVRRRDMPLEPARKLGKLVKDNGWDSADQLAWWEEQQRGRADAAAARKAVKVARKEQVPVAASVGPLAPGPVFTAVKTEETPSVPADPSPTQAPAAPQVEARPADPVSPTPKATPAGPSLPEPRGTRASEPAVADESAVHPPAATWQLPPGGWEATFNMVLAQMGEFDRHMLTRKLVKVMDKELGRAPAGD